MRPSPEHPFNTLKRRFHEAKERVFEDFEPTDLAFDLNAEDISRQLDYLAFQLTSVALMDNVPRILTLQTSSGSELTTLRRLEDQQLQRLVSVVPQPGSEYDTADIRFSLPIDFFPHSAYVVLFTPCFASLKCNNPETIQEIVSSVGLEEYNQKNDMLIWRAMLAECQELYNPQEWVADSSDFIIAWRRGSAIYSKWCLIDDGQGFALLTSLRKKRMIDPSHVPIARRFSIPQQEIQPEIDLFLRYGSVHILQEGAIEKEKDGFGKKESLPAGQPPSAS